MKRQHLWIGLAVLAVLGILYGIFFWSNDEKLIRQRIDGLAEAASFSEGANPAIYGLDLKRALREALTQDASVDAPELGGGALGVEELTGAGVRFAGTYRSATVKIFELKIAVNGSKATADGRLVMTANEHGSGVRVDQRKVRFELVKASGTWRISRLTVAPMP